MQTDITTTDVIIEPVVTTQGEGTEQSKQVSTEEYEKVSTKLKNLEEAWKQDREALKSYKQKDLDSEEKKKLEKWKHEEVIIEQKKTIDSLTTKASAYDDLQAKINKQQSDEYESILTNLPEDIKTKYVPKLDKLDMEDKISFLKDLIIDIKQTDYTAKPKEEGWSKPDDFKLLEEKVSAHTATNSERSEYLKQLRQVN